MALTAKFVADFTSFYDAVQKASVMTKDLAKEADKASGQFNKMVDSLSGDKVVKQATLMVRAIEEIGGVSKLTDQNLKRVGSTVSEAVQQMERMGAKVPQSFRNVQAAAEAVNKPTESWASSLTNLTNIARGFMGLQIVGFLKDAANASLQWASSLSKMKAQTDLTYRDLQILEDVAATTGTGIETLAKGIQVMQQKIGDRTARKAIQDLGLSFDAILKMKPADQFAAIASALAKIEDPTLRNVAGARLFGNIYRELMPAMRADLDQIAKSTKIVGDTQIESLDRTSNVLNKFWRDSKKGWADYFAYVIGLDEARIKSVEKENAQIAALLKARAGIPTLPGAPAGLPIGAGPVTGGMEPEDISRLQIYGQTLDQTAAATTRLTAAETIATKGRNEFAAMSKVAAGAEFEWQNQLALTKFKADQLTVAETQLYEATATLADFVASHQGEMFPEPPPGSLEAWKAGQKTIVEMAPQVGKLGQAVGFMNTHLGAVEGILGGIQTGWAQVAVVGARAVQSITQNLISGNWVGAIVAATSALGGFIAKLFGASEESKKVSPMRDEFFRLQGGLETLNPRVQALEGNLKSVQAVFDAKTVQQYEAAIANLNRILDKESAAFYKATDAAEDYADALRSVPKTAPQSAGNVPGFATGTHGQFVNFGSGTLAMLHGREAIVPESAVKSAGGGGGGGLGATVIINAQGAFFDTPGDLQRLADKVNEALTAKHGLTNRTRAA